MNRSAGPAVEDGAPNPQPETLSCARISWGRASKSERVGRARARHPPSCTPTRSGPSPGPGPLETCVLALGGFLQGGMIRVP